MAVSATKTETGTYTLELTDFASVPEESSTIAEARSVHQAMRKDVLYRAGVVYVRMLELGWDNVVFNITLPELNGFELPQPITILREMPKKEGDDGYVVVRTGDEINGNSIKFPIQFKDGSLDVPYEHTEVYIPLDEAEQTPVSYYYSTYDLEQTDSRTLSLYLDGLMLGAVAEFLAQQLHARREGVEG